MTKTPVDDRRAHVRHETSFTVQGQGEEGVIARMVARNLSLGGLHCVSNTDFPEMTRIAVRLMLPRRDDVENPQDPVDIEAVVVRREKRKATNGDDKFDLALFFTGLEAEAKTKIERYIRTP